METMEVIKKHRIKANVDEKNVNTDWIFDCLLLDGNGVIEIPSDKGYSYIGTFGKSILNVYYQHDDNKVIIKFLHTLTNEPNKNDKDKIYKFFLTDFKSDDNDLKVTVTQVDEDTIIAEFFWEVKE